MLEPFALMIVLIVAIVTVGDIYKKKQELYYRDGKGGHNELLQIQTDLNELKKNVADIREYITDLYIQQDDRNTKAR